MKVEQTNWMQAPPSPRGGDVQDSSKMQAMAALAIAFLAFMAAALSIDKGEEFSPKVVLLAFIGVTAFALGALRLPSEGLLNYEVVEDN